MVSLSLAKQHLGVLHDDQDDLIQQYIDAATIDVEKLSGQLMTRREVTQRHSEFGTWLPLDWGPDPENVTVSYFDATDDPQEITDGKIVRDRLYDSGSGWPEIYENSQIEVTYTAGWETEPSNLVDAVLVLVGGKFQEREGSYADALRAAEATCGRNRPMQV